MEVLLATKYFQKTFEGETFKEAYLAANKWLAQNVISKVEVGETLWKIEKIQGADLPACKLILYVILEESQFVNDNCNRCQEFHKLFYMNQQYNCDACNMQAYRKGLAQKLEIKKQYRKNQLKRVVEEE